MTCMFIGGHWCDPASGETISAICPSTGAEIDRIGAGNATDIDRAVAAARAAFEGDWGRITATERGRLLTALGLKVLEHADELADIEARDTGKPISQARADIGALSRYCEYYGGAADKLHGETLPYLNGYSASVINEPYGVTGHIIPWNYPAQMFGRSLAPSLAVGNATVLKPAEDACLSILRVVELAKEVGFPAGAINLVTGLGESAGAALAAHPGVDFVSFTGSPEAGILVQKAAAEHYAPCILELGGKSPQIVFEDADIDRTVPFLVNAIVQNGGQTCSAGSRVLVQESVYDEVVSRLQERFSNLRAGSHEADLDCGPLISARQRDRVNAFIKRAKSTGVPVMAEGKLDASAESNGFYVAPTLFAPVPRDSEIAREEVFGPVLVVLPFTDEADAIKLANDTDYGLIAAIWTSDGARQRRMPAKLRCGQVFINCYGAGGGVELPFGGVGKSGHGREKGFVAMAEFCRGKTVVQQYDDA